MTALPDTHLDLGCGPVPRNPYARSRLCGIDLVATHAAPGIEIRVANLAVEPIPYPDDHFGSVSAYDFLEHVPRVLATPDGRGTRMPFVELMGEIWRVLAPGGVLYALTPAYPDAAAFQDPTHVNIITEKTHYYFCAPDPEAQMYGFRGCFRALRRERVVRDDALMPGPLSLNQRWRHLRKRVKGQLSHLVWELEAIKPVP